MPLPQEPKPQTSQVKKEVSAKNTTMKIADVMALTKQVLRNVTKDNWENAVRHTIDVEKAHWKGDGLREEIEPVVIFLGSDESSYEESDSEDDEEDLVVAGVDESEHSSALREWIQLFGESDDDDFCGF